MPVIGKQVTVGENPVELARGGTSVDPVWAVVRNSHDTVDVEIGGADVEDGFILDADGGILPAVPLGSDDVVYAKRVGAVDGEVHVLVTRQ